LTTIGYPEVKKGHRGLDCVVVDLQLSVQSVPITTKVVNSNLLMARCTQLIQLDVIKFVSDLQQVGGFLRVLQFPPPIKLTAIYNWSIDEGGVKHHNPNNIQSVAITTNIVSLNPTQARCVRYNISWWSLSVTCGR